MANKFVLDVKKLKGTKLFVVDVSAMMRTNYVKLSTGSGEDVFNGYSNKFKKRELSWEVDGEIFNTSALYGLLRIFRCMVSITITCFVLIHLRVLVRRNRGIIRRVV